jgi:hypothetical protein
MRRLNARSFRRYAMLMMAARERRSVTAVRRRSWLDISMAEVASSIRAGISRSEALFPFKLPGAEQLCRPIYSSASHFAKMRLRAATQPAPHVVKAPPFEPTSGGGFFAMTQDERRLLELLRARTARLMLLLAQGFKFELGLVRAGFVL